MIEWEIINWRLDAGLAWPACALYAHIKVIAVNWKINQLHLSVGIIWMLFYYIHGKRILFSRVFLSTQFIPFQFSHRLMCCVVYHNVSGANKLCYCMRGAMRCDAIIWWRLERGKILMMTTTISFHSHSIPFQRDVFHTTTIIQWMSCFFPITIPFRIRPGII